MTGLSALGLATAAACIGFLIWNWHPAKVFMGDTGSLFMGGMVCALAFGMDLPIAAAAGGLCVPLRDPLGGAAGDLLQGHPRQAPV